MGDGRSGQGSDLQPSLNVKSRQPPTMEHGSTGPPPVGRSKSSRQSLTPKARPSGTFQLGAFTLRWGGSSTADPYSNVEAEVECLAFFEGETTFEAADSKDERCDQEQKSTEARPRQNSPLGHQWFDQAAPNLARTPGRVAPNCNGRHWPPAGAQRVMENQSAASKAKHLIRHGSPVPRNGSSR